MEVAPCRSSSLARIEVMRQGAASPTALKGNIMVDKSLLLTIPKLAVVSAIE